jgi:general secretion pathway protein D
MPQQVLIETKIMEVNRDVLRDIGFDWGLGSRGAAQTSTVSTTALTKTDVGNKVHALGGHSLSGLNSPSVFSPKDSTMSGVEPFDVGLELLWQKIGGTEFEAILHALEEDVSTNTLSAPRILALNNQEASIIIGTRYPILATTVSGTDSTTTTVSLDYYQDIGIQLNVVPQIGANNYINMVLHPAITEQINVLGTNQYPIINTREAETRVVMKDGETIVIGGLLKDVKAKGITGIPILSKIPFLGVFFRRETVDTQKIDLLIFITANIIKEGQFTPQEIAKLEEDMAAKGAQAKGASGK